MMKLKSIFAIAATSVALCACSGTASQATNTATADSTSVQAPQFDADSAYAHVQRQCEFGPRVPGTKAHAECGSYIEASLRAHCDSVVVQHAPVTTFDGTKLNIANYIGIINPQAERRLLLLAHWDCRPWADNDPDPAKHREPVMGANDAASGVAVLLELARALQQQSPAIGVDLLFTDAEDWGKDDDENSWALGTQYWTNHMHTEGYSPMFGILLDMVGATGAQFGLEFYSQQYAGGFLKEVWRVAQEGGYGNYFSSTASGAITDDHVPVNRAGIACIDIIDIRQGSFFEHWHTTHDTLDCIDRNTLKAVGQTLVNLVYEY